VNDRSTAAKITTTQIIEASAKVIFCINSAMFRPLKPIGNQ
jgi:hypothetical protein